MIKMFNRRTTIVLKVDLISLYFIIHFDYKYKVQNRVSVAIDTALRTLGLYLKNRWFESTRYCF